MGDKFLVHGNVEDLSLTMGAVNGLTDGLPKLEGRGAEGADMLKKCTSPEEGGGDRSRSVRQARSAGRRA